jgi:hypothetical protein
MASLSHPRSDPNGGFPEPLDGQPTRTVARRHPDCGATTRVRIPRVVGADAVRRVVCERCHETFEVAEPQGGRIGVPGWLSDPDSPAWRYLSIPVAAAAVVGALVLLQGC